MCSGAVKTARDELVEAAKAMGAPGWWLDPDADHFPDVWLKLAWAIRAWDDAHA